MLVALDAPYVDTSAAELSFALDLAERPALHVLELPLPGAGGGARSGSRPSASQPAGLLRLRLLGASHQVVLRTAGHDLVETLACLPGHPPDLPAVVDADDGYRFSARALRLSAGEFAGRADRLRRQLTGDPHALVGVFPGSPDALTALHTRIDGARISWRTWHAYPQTAELVETETVVTVR
ncbi:MULTISPECIES: DUF2617 family protein [unclassified Micromonospora]|uniref:DUF2617 family protein n=1 Tax=unclassified Micromonospora TaxID=2617518 RepID=UPI003A893702